MQTEQTLFKDTVTGSQSKCLSGVKDWKNQIQVAYFNSWVRGIVSSKRRFIKKGKNIQKCKKRKKPKFCKVKCKIFKTGEGCWGITCYLNKS